MRPTTDWRSAVWASLSGSARMDSVASTFAENPEPPVDHVVAEGDADVQYTIDELASESGVPSRTIRFYQSKGTLPPPKRRGRVAYYSAGHLDRLHVISELQDRGLRLDAIRDALDSSDNYRR